MLRARLILFLFIFFSWAITAEKISPYYPKKGFDSPSMFQTQADYHKVGSVFENTARTASATFTQGSVAAHEDFFGYRNLELSTLIPLSKWTLGLGYFSKSVDDIQETARDSTQAHGVAILGSLKDQHQQGLISVAYPLSDQVFVGSKLQYFSEQLGPASINSVTLDFAISLSPADFINIGLYSRNLFQSERVWSNATEEELFKRDAVLELQWRHPRMQVHLATDFENLRGLYNYKFNTYLNLVSDTYFALNSNSHRYSYGAILSFQYFSMQYSQLRYSEEFFGLDQHRMGVVFYY